MAFKDGGFIGPILHALCYKLSQIISEARSQAHATLIGCSHSILMRTTITLPRNPSTWLSFVLFITYFFIDDALRSVPCTLAPALTRLAYQGELTSQLGLLGLLLVHTLGKELCVLAL